MNPPANIIPQRLPLDYIISIVHHSIKKNQKLIILQSFIKFVFISQISETIQLFFLHLLFLIHPALYRHDFFFEIERNRFKFFLLVLCDFAVIFLKLKSMEAEVVVGWLMGSSKRVFSLFKENLNINNVELKILCCK